MYKECEETSHVVRYLDKGYFCVQCPMQFKSVEPDATSGEECCNFCIGVRGCNQPDCPCHSKQTPEALRMPQVKSSDERQDNPRSGLKLPEKLEEDPDIAHYGLHGLTVKINEVIECLTALQKEG